jgi:hypothetical protein
MVVTSLPMRVGDLKIQHELHNHFSYNRPSLFEGTSAGLFLEYSVPFIPYFLGGRVKRLGKFWEQARQDVIPLWRGQG